MKKALILLRRDGSIVDVKASFDPAFERVTHARKRRGWEQVETANGRQLGADGEEDVGRRFHPASVVSPHCAQMESPRESVWSVKGNDESVRNGVLVRGECTA